MRNSSARRDSLHNSPLGKPVFQRSVQRNGTILCKEENGLIEDEVGQVNAVCGHMRGCGKPRLLTCYSTPYHAVPLGSLFGSTEYRVSYRCSIFILHRDIAPCLSHLRLMVPLLIHSNAQPYPPSPITQPCAERFPPPPKACPALTTLPSDGSSSFGIDVHS